MWKFWKRSEGFEWREYVRTTILLRRQRRRDKLVDAKEAAMAGLKDAGRKGASAGATGLAAFWRWAATGLAWLGGWLTVALAALGRLPGKVLRPLAPAFSALMRTVALPNVRQPILLIGAIGLAAAAYRVYALGFDREASIAASLGLGAFALAAAPILFGAGKPGLLASFMARMPAVSPVVKGGLIVTALAAFAGWGLARYSTPQISGSLLSSLPSLPISIPNPLASAKPIEGRASALSGDLLRVSNQVVRIAGIEAPEREQRCGVQSRKAWRCGEAAQKALGGLVQGRPVSCTLSGTDEAGRALATCRADGTDIGAALVRAGHVFAQQGMFARYASAEIEARNAKSGMWKGDVERPADWRSKRWEEAKRSAPDGCPIKGSVGADGKTYVLPWAREYEKVKVNNKRGERWFCTEQDARAAGWRLAERS